MEGKKRKERKGERKKERRSRSGLSWELVHPACREEATKAAYFVRQPCVRAFNLAVRRKMESSSSRLGPILKGGGKWWWWRTIGRERLAHHRVVIAVGNRDRLKLTRAPRIYRGEHAAHRHARLCHPETLLTWSDVHGWHPLFLVNRPSNPPMKFTPLIATWNERILLIIDKLQRSNEI